MNILVTGSRGLVGSQVRSDLPAFGHTAVDYDLKQSQDILDYKKLRAALRHCNSIIHCAALLGSPSQSHEEIMAVNLQGTWNVLAAAMEAGISRVVFLSSVDVLGVFKGERALDYLPLDDAHACHPTSPYGISKRLAEEMCRFVSTSSAVSVVCLRPPGVWTEETYAWIEAERSKRPAFEWDPYWEYGAFIDVRDLSRACIKALTCDVDRFACLLVSAPDITTSGRTSRQLAASVCPGVEWRGSKHFEEDEYLSLIDIANAQRLLSWVPECAWRSYLERGSQYQPHG